MMQNQEIILTTASAQATTFTYTVDGILIQGFLVKPLGEGVFPVIIWNRGGTGDFSKITRDVVYLDLLPFAEAGCVVIASQYRIHDEHMGADLHDVEALYPIIKELPFADEKRIGMIGHSRGGAVVYQMLRKSDYIKVAAIGAAPTDYHQVMNERPDMRELFTEMGISSEQELDKRSAIQFVDELPENVPLLLYHGSADDRVLPHHTLDMAKKLNERGIPNEVLILEGKGHWIREVRQLVNGKILEFFKPHLNPKS